MPEQPDLLWSIINGAIGGVIGCVFALAVRRLWEHYREPEIPPSLRDAFDNGPLLTPEFLKDLTIRHVPPKEESDA